MNRYLLVAVAAGAMIPAPGLPCGGFFYEMPPPLSAYPERHPAKAFWDVFADAYPAPEGTMTADELAEACAALVGQFGIASGDDTRRRALELIEANRASADYRVRFANLLYEVVELAEADGGEAAMGYLEWRLDQASRDDGFVRERPVRRPHYGGDDPFPAREARWLNATLDPLGEIGAALESAPDHLRPHWLVQRGALYFRQGLFAQAAADFGSVLDGWENHARAEVALLMRARCALEMARRQPGEPAGVNSQATWALRREADAFLVDYAVRYPDGRFVADALGWRGAVASDGGDLGRALGFYLGQLEVRGSREITRSALRECDRLFTELVESPEDDAWHWGQAPMDKIAAHPAAALMLVYRCLDPAARVDSGAFPFAEYMGDERIVRDLHRRIVLPRPVLRDLLVQLGREVGRRPDAYDGTFGSTSYLVILASVASEEGQQEVALRICRRAGEQLEENADLLLAYAVALQRSRKFAEAAAAFETLIRSFPESPLCSGDVRFRWATCLREAGHAGLAAAALMGQDATGDGQTAVSLQHTTGEVWQWVDSLLQFAPLEELEEALETDGLLDTVGAERFRVVVRGRAFAEGDFERAKRWITPDMSAEMWDDYRMPWLRRWLDRPPGMLDSERWTELVTPILAARSAGDPLAAARAWERARGYLTAPSVTFGGEGDDADLRRRLNAIESLGIDGEEAGRELERRDEAWHALDAYARAADAYPPGSAGGAEALEGAIRCLQKLAEFSPFGRARAFERADAERSRALYDRLQSEHPGSPEAGRAVFWSLPSPPEAGSWLPGDFSSWRLDYRIQFVLSAFSSESDGSDRRGGVMPFRDRLEEEVEAGGPGLGGRLGALRRDLLAVYRYAEQASLLSDLDDLTAFLDAFPDLGPEAHMRYIRLRLDGDGDTHGLEEAEDFLAFLRNRATEPSLAPAAAAAAWESFLERFPGSPKAEAAEFRRARILARSRRARVSCRSTEWPDAPKPDGYKTVAVVRPDSEHWAAREAVAAALDRYDARYPGGRYEPEVGLLRAGWTADGGDFRGAMAGFCQVLDDGTARDLHLDAALGLAELFMGLIDQPDARAALVAALRENPEARSRLADFMRSETPGARLRLLEGWLRTVGALG
ncbi:hypothetical protein BH23VER1_BH23VER1_25720 [soil metagenome]